MNGNTASPKAAEPQPNPEPAADPHELTNLIGLESYEEAARAMRQRILRRMLAAGEARPVIESAPTRPGGQRRAP